MSLKKKDLEMVYSLRWRNGPKRDGKKDMFIVVVYDIPATTMNLEVFKNYLLKNSGTPEEDISVSFIMDNGKEYPINSQVDFQVALYAFRRKARAGEVINLLLERISDRPNHKNLRHSNDVETQFDTVEPNSIVSTCCNNSEAPPEWFNAAIAQLKTEIKEEVAEKVTAIMSNALAEFKSPSPFALPSGPLPHPYSTVCAHRTRTKRDKPVRKLAHLAENTADAKDLIKSYKLERKLEKLEHKASKYREKRLALQHGQKLSDQGPKSSDSEAGPSTRKSQEDKRKSVVKVEKPEEEKVPKMDAQPVNVQTSYPHMIGGEVYMHQWEVKNTGQDQWNAWTQLEYTWGSKKLVPVEKSVAVPHLKPGEQGVVSVCLQVPAQTGGYECYWQFVHKGRRFGHWLGVQVVVDGFGFKGATPKTDEEMLAESFFRRVRESENESLQGPVSDAAEELVKNVSDRFEALKMRPKQQCPFLFDDDSDCSWSSEPTHFWTKTEEKGDYVVVPVPQCFVLDTPESAEEEKKSEVVAKQQSPAAENFDTNNNSNNENSAAAGGEDRNSLSAASSNSIKLRDEELDNIVVITVPKDEQVKEGFIYVHVDGQKVLIPKNILKSEVVTAAQELERSPSAATSVGVIVDGVPNEPSLTTDSPTPSVASTVTPKTEPFVANNTNALDCSATAASSALQEPLVPQQAVDLTTTATRDPSEERSSYFEASNYMSHCSAAGSCYSEVNAQAERQNRVFVFPQNIPGYEVVYPVSDVEEAMLIEQPINPFMEPVANFQQTPPEERVSPEVLARPPTAPLAQEQQPVTANVMHAQPTEQVHILPEALVTGAVNVASSALNTARSVINMIKPQQSPGRWENGHWVSTSPMSPREANLQALAEMGFWNRDLNATLLARFNDDLNRVVAELVQ